MHHQAVSVEKGQEQKQVLAGCIYFFKKMNKADVLFKKRNLIALGMYMFCIVVIKKQKYCFERKE